MLDDNHNPYLGYDMIGRWDMIGFYWSVCLIVWFTDKCLCVLCLYMRFSNCKQNKTKLRALIKENKKKPETKFFINK